MVSDFFMENLYKNTIESPIGYLEITTDDNSLLSISFCKKENLPTLVQPVILTQTINQLTEYFNGKRKEFELNMNPAGTEFQQKVWENVINISFGETATYHEIALKTGSVNNSRAVGLANGKNPIPIIIPCH